MWLQASPEIGGAHARVDDCEDDQDDGDDGESGEGATDGVVEVAPRVARVVRVVLVHAHELEEEVGEACEVEGL